MTPVLMQFLTSTGEPLAFANVDIQLTRSDFDPEEDGIIMPRLVQTKTGMDGKVIVNLMPAPEHYHVTVQDTLTDTGLHYHFYVPVVNSPDAVVRLQDIVVDPNAKLSEVAYDEQALLNILTAKAEAMSARDAAEGFAIDAQTSATYVGDTAAQAIDAKDTAVQAATDAGTARDQIMANIQSAADNALLAEDRAASALQSKTDAATSATNAAGSATTAANQAAAAVQSAQDAQASEDTAVAARDVATGAATIATGARDVAVTARDEAVGARDTAVSAKDMAVEKANQLASQLAAFNEIYIGKFAAHPTVDGNGNALKVGAIYENTVEGKIYQWESDLAWHPYDEESQSHLNNAILSANNAAASATAANTSKEAASQSAADALAYRDTASTHAANASTDAAAALTAKNDAQTAATTATGAAATATTKASEAAQSAADAQAAAELATGGQVQADWAQTDTAALDFIKNKPAVWHSGNDGAGSGLDADLLDGMNASTAATANTIAARDASGNLNASYLVGVHVSMGHAATTRNTDTTFFSSNDTYIRKNSKAGFLTSLGLNNVENKSSATILGELTGADVRTKLGVTTLTGSNTGDESQSSIMTKLGAATASVAGYLLAVDWARFNGKQDALGYSPVNPNIIGAANGLAPLGSDSKIPATYLPSFVDDVLEYTNQAGFPATGETGKIYVALDTNRTYRWGGSAYTEISASPGTTDSVTEGATNLYHTASRVLGTVITGLSTASSAVIAATDSILTALGKLQAQVNLKANLSGAAFTGNISSTGIVSASATGGFANSTYAENVRNPIWRFGNADGYGISYFQGTAGWGGVDSIGFHFGTPTAAGSLFSVNYNGTAKVAGTMQASRFEGRVSDSGDVIRSYNTTASGEPSQFYIKHSLGDAVMGNDRGSLRLIGTADTATNATNLGNVSSARTMQKRRREINNTGPSLNSLLNYPAEYGFAYAGEGNASGPFMHFGGLAYDGDYCAQFSLSYNDSGNIFRFRTHNGDTVAWNSWKEVWHSGNLNVSTSALANSVVQRNNYGYVFGNYINMTDDGNPGDNGNAVTAIITKRGDDYYRSTGKAAIKTFLQYTGSDILTSTSETLWDIYMSKYMRWKKYGNGHVIIDASEGTAPNGAAINQTNPDNPWGAGYPTLMGWNGQYTYGVRVDSSRYADSALNAGELRTLGNYIWNANWSPSSWGAGAGMSFVRGEDGFPHYGTVVSFRAYTSHPGGTFQIYSPYDPTMGGNNLKVRLCDYTNSAWTPFRTIPFMELDSQYWTGLQYFQLNKGSTTYGLNGVNYTNFYTTDGSAAGISLHRGGNYATNFTLDIDDYVGLGGWSAGASRKFAFGMAGGDFVAAGNITAYSDERLKTNWRGLGDDFVERWANVTHGIYDRTDNGERQVGLGADSVRRILPDAVQRGKDGFLSLNYGNAAGVASVKLAQRCVQLEDLLRSALERIDQLEQKVGI